VSSPFELAGASSRGLLLALTLAGCGGGPARPNVVIVSIDTLRADFAGPWGGPSGSTPNIEELAAGATVYERCIATAPWTVPSHASMFTGLFPFEHGAHSFELEEAGDNVFPLDERHTTLAEVLSGAGYRTGAFVANAVYLNPRYGLAQGFEEWEVAREPGVELNTRALEWLDQAPGAEPFLLFINYLDAHRPYNVTPRGDEAEYSTTEHPARLLDELIDTVMVRGEDDPALRAKVIEQYRRGVRWADEAVGQLVAALKERGSFEDTIFVITSDHGEYFGEHGLVEHSKDVYPEALQVPLLIRWPRQDQGVRLPVTASHVDIPTLVTRRLGRDLALEGQRVFPHLPDRRPLLAENYFSRPGDLLQPEYGERFRRTRTALFTGRHMVLMSSDGAHEMYARGAPFTDIAAEQQDTVERVTRTLRDLLDSGRFEHGEAAAPALDAEHLREMQELGYLGAEED